MSTAAYFCHSRLSHLEYNCSVIKVDWLAGRAYYRIPITFATVAHGTAEKNLVARDALAMHHGVLWGCPPNLILVF